jgi:hypothetical protein
LAHGPSVRPHAPRLHGAQEVVVAVHVSDTHMVSSFLRTGTKYVLDVPIPWPKYNVDNAGSFTNANIMYCPDQFKRLLRQTVTIPFQRDQKRQIWSILLQKWTVAHEEAYLLESGKAQAKNR